MITSLSFAQKDSTKVDNFQKTDEILSIVVKKALTVAEKTGEFAIEQAPLLLQEFYNWHIWSNILGIILGLLLCFLGYKIPFLFTTKESNYNDYKYFNRYCDDYFFPYLNFILFTISGVIFIFPCIYDLIFILIAPKLYLIEHFIK